MFGILGLLQYFSAKYRFYPNVLKYVFVLVDCVLLAVILISQNPFNDTVIPPAIVMNGRLFTHFCMFLMQTAFSFRPHLLLWCGFCIVAARTGMLLWLLDQPDLFTNLDLSEQTAAVFVAARTDPNFLFLGFWMTEIIVALLVTLGLAASARCLSSVMP